MICMLCDSRNTSSQNFLPGGHTASLSGLVFLCRMGKKKTMKSRNTGKSLFFFFELLKLINCIIKSVNNVES